MTAMLEYKGYFGSVDYSDEDQVLHGRLQFIRDLVTYEGTDAKTLKQAFQEAVDDYLSEEVPGAYFDPALMNAGTPDDTDDQDEITGDLHRIADTLPPPDQLVPRDDTVKSPSPSAAAPSTSSNAKPPNNTSPTNA